MRKKHKIMMAALSVAILTLGNGCTSQQPTKEPSAQQPASPAKDSPTQAAGPDKSAATPAPAQPAPGQPAQNPPVANGQTAPIVPEVKPTPANRNDYTNELILHPSIVVGKTTMDEMIAAYGQPVKTETRPTPYTVPAAGGKKPVEQIMASFLVNPLTGKKHDKPYPFYFTKNKKILAAAPIFFQRDKLFEKQMQNKLTFADVIQSYGKLTRITDTYLQLIDYDHHIAIRVDKAADGHLSAVISKYDLFFAGQPAAMKDYEDTAKLAQKLNEILEEDKKQR